MSVIHDLEEQMARDRLAVLEYVKALCSWDKSVLEGDEVRYRVDTANGRYIFRDDGVYLDASMKYTEARGADGLCYSCVGDVPPPGFVEPEPVAPPTVVTHVDHDRKIITVSSAKR